MDKQAFRRCIMILADGARYDLMRSLLDAGELPEIKKHLVDRGGFKKGVTVFPSTTGPAYLPFLTGCFPGTVGITGIRWFDKKRFQHRSYCGLETFLMRKDIPAAYLTLFELLPRSWSIFSAVYRGPWRHDLTQLMRIWYVYYAHLTDHWGVIDFAAAKKLFKIMEKDFQLLFVVLPGIDEHSHMTHPHHDSTIDRYRFLDKTVGKVAERLQKQGRYEETLLWIFSDHGLSRTDTHFCLNEFLETRGVKPFYYPRIHDRFGKQAANMMSGNGMTHLYFRGAKRWNENTPRNFLEAQYPGMIEQLQKEAAVDVMAIRNDKAGIDILSKKGEASLYFPSPLVGEGRVRGCEKRKYIHYVVKDKDPFGYPKLPVMLDAEQALQKTAESEYPDALWQLAQLFKSDRTGDVVLSAKSGFDFRKAYEVPEHRGSHGSLCSEHMWVPMLTNASLSCDIVRTVDVFPTTLRLLNQPIPDNIDGIIRVN